MAPSPRAFLAHRVPKGARKEFDLGYKAWRRNQFNEAQPHFAEAVRLDPSFLEALTGLAVVHLKLRQSELALNNLNGALALEPDWAMLHSNKANDAGSSWGGLAGGAPGRTA